MKMKGQILGAKRKFTMMKQFNAQYREITQRFSPSVHIFVQSLVKFAYFLFD